MKVPRNVETRHILAPDRHLMIHMEAFGAGCVDSVDRFPIDPRRCGAGDVFTIFGEVARVVRAVTLGVGSLPFLDALFSDFGIGAMLCSPISRNAFFVF